MTKYFEKSWILSTLAPGRLSLVFRLVRESDSCLEVALRHVVGIHPENVRVMVRVFKPYNIYFPA